MPKKEKELFTKHTHKTKDRVTRIPLKTGGIIRYSGRESSSCSTSGNRRVNLVTNPLISHELGKNREVLTKYMPFKLTCSKAKCDLPSRRPMYACSSWSVTFRILNICSDTTGQLEVERNFSGMKFVRPTTEIPNLFYPRQYTTNRQTIHDQ